MKNNNKYQPFTNTRETWDPDISERITIKMDPVRSGGKATLVKVEDKFFVLTGTETVEQFVIWWKEYIDKVKKREGLTYNDKIDILKRIVKDTAKKTFHLTMDQTSDDIDRHEWKWKIAQMKMKKLWEEGMTDTDIELKKANYRVKKYCQGKKTALKATPGTGPLFDPAVDDPATLEEYQELVFGELHYRLAELILGANKYGRQSFIHAKRQIQNHKMYVGTGVKTYSERILEWNSYLQYLLWEAGNAKGQVPAPFDNDELVEFMDSSLPDAYRTALDDQQYDVWSHSFQETIDTLVVMEEKIRRELAQQKDVEKLLRKNNLSASTIGKSGGKSGNGGNGDGGDGGGSIKSKKKRKRHGGGGDGGGNDPKGKFPVCKWCDKMHLGRCRTLDNPKHKNYGKDKKGGKHNYEGLGVSQKKYEQIRTMQEKAKKNRKRRYDSDSDSDSSDSSGDSDFRKAKKWRKGLSLAEACFVAQDTGNHEVAFDEDASLNSDTSLKELLKSRQRAKKTVKKMKR
jgi:hypothetical protein